MDLVCLTETWLQSDFFSSEFFPDSYSVLRCDRDPSLGFSTGGGVLLAYRSHYVVEPLDLSMVRHAVPLIDVLGCRLHLNHTRSLLVVTVYIPPHVQSSDLELFIDTMEDMCIGENILIVGDFNVFSFANGDFSDARSRLIKNFSDFMNLKQYNIIPNNNNHILDLVLSDIECTVSRSDTPLVNEDCHHPALHISLSLDNHRYRGFNVNSDCKHYNFRKANFPALYHCISNINWDELYTLSNVDSACTQFYRVLYGALDMFVPRVESSKRYSKYPRWFTSEIIRDIREKNKARRKYLRYGNNSDQQRFRELRTKIKNDVSIAYQHYVEQVEITLSTDSNIFWNYVRDKARKSRIPGVMLGENGTKYSTPEEIINGFRNYFKSVHVSSTDVPSYYDNLGDSNSPSIHINQMSEDEILLCMGRLKSRFTSGLDQIPSFLVKDCASAFLKPLHYIFNLSLRSGTFPKAWKICRMCPVSKTGKSSNISDYRPIAIVSNFSKVFEMALYSNIYPLVRNYISPSQHGFMKSRSTTTNLVQIAQYISEVLDERGQVDVIYTDLSKAFDIIDHNILLSKLRFFGFSPLLIDLFTTYILDREHYVCINGYKSEVFCPTSGIPQGSNLGPLLFILYIDDLHDDLTCFSLMYADDVKLYQRVDSHSDCLYLQSQIDCFVNWCDRNRLKININKCAIVSYSRKPSPVVFDYCIFDQAVERQCNFKDLGVIFDDRLTFIPHIDDVTSKSLRTLGFILRNTRSFTNLESLKTLFFSLVRTKLEYCSIVWSPIYHIYIQRVESVQRRFMKCMCFRQDHVYPQRGVDNQVYLERFDMCSLQERRIIQFVAFLYKLLHGGIDCPSLLNYLSFNVPRISNRHACIFNMRTCRTNMLSKSPIYMMCCLANTISLDIDIHSDCLNVVVDAVRNNFRS